MSGRIRLLSCVLALPLFAGTALGQPNTVTRFIEFRDGSVLRLPVVNQPWKVTLILSSGQIKTLAMLPEKIQTLSLTPEQDFDKKRQLLSHVLKLGSDEFKERENSWHALFKLGPSICADLKACLQLTDDAEIQARLIDLIQKLHEGDPKLIKSRVVFDRFELAEHFWGYLEDSPIEVVVNGKQYALNRKDVSRVSSLPPSSRVSVQRISEKEFPPDCAEEGFEINPISGQALKTGENVEKTFLNKGLILTSALKNSFAAANSFSVAGKSGGISIANHEPLWEGELIIRFVQPGKEHIPAAVDYFGCYVAAVVPNGTHLIAYDLQDRELGKITTKEHNTEFLGVHSEIPIHKIRIVPNVEIDANYTLDDFIFRYASTVQASHPDKVLVEIAGGDSILCKDVTLKGKQAELHGLPAGLPDMTVPLDALLRINPSQTPKVQKQEGLFAELTDGSILFAPEPADKRKMPVFARYPQLLKERKDLVGVWTTKSGRKLNAPNNKQMYVWNGEQQTWEEIGYVQFLEELVLWRKGDSKFAAAGYPQFTTLWFAPAKVGPIAGSWHVQTILGEDLVLTQGQPLSGRLSEGVTVSWQGKSMQLPLAQIMSIYQVPAKKLAP